MNRLKLWLFALVVVGLALASLYPLSVELRGPALSGLDLRIDAAIAAARGAERSTSARLAGVAQAAARDPRLAAALAGPQQAEPEDAGKRRRAPPPPPPQDPAALDAAVSEAAQAAVAEAERLLLPVNEPLRAPTPNGTAAVVTPERLVIAGTREGLDRRPAAPAEAAAVELVKAALDGKVQQGWRVLGDRLAYGVAVPAGDGAALGVFALVDERWVATAVADTGAAGVLTAPGVKPIASDKTVQVPALLDAVKKGTRDVGELPAVRLELYGVKLPPLPSLTGKLPALRVKRAPLLGLAGGALLVAVPTGGALDPVGRAQALVIWGAALIALLALLFSVLVKPTEVAAPVPPELVEVASKMERGDFSVRAPVMAGKVGTVASALNKAAEAAEGAGRMATASASSPSVTQEFFQRNEPAPEPEGDPFALPIRGPRTAPAPLETPPPVEAPTLTGTAFEAAPVAAPRPSAPPPAPPPAPVSAPTPAPVAAAPAEEDSEQQHWREVFREFVRVRTECGEPAEGLTFDRFRQKLEANKAALVAKYACKTVRFAVYVKEGKAALKATPVR
ncbi:MAG: MXAN_5187 family protein [Anaeromyxobacter sp.]